MLTQPHEIEPDLNFRVHCFTTDHNHLCVDEGSETDGLVIATVN